MYRPFFYAILADTPFSIWVQESNDIAMSVCYVIVFEQKLTICDGSITNFFFAIYFLYVFLAYIEITIWRNNTHFAMFALAVVRQ